MYSRNTNVDRGPRRTMGIEVHRYSSHPTLNSKVLVLSKSKKGKLLTFLALTIVPIVIIFKIGCAPVQGDINDIIQVDKNDTIQIDKNDTRYQRDLSEYRNVSSDDDEFLTRLQVDKNDKNDTIQVDKIDTIPGDINDTIKGDINDTIQGDVNDTCYRRDLSKYRTVSRNDEFRTRLPSGKLTDTDCLTFHCTTSESCNNYLPTNYDGPDPPCCPSILRDMARIFDDTMCDLGLDYVTAFGTLLGLVRSDRLIPWTSDNDYIVLPNSMNAMVDLWDANATGMSLIFQGIPRLCATSKFAKGKLQRWNMAAKSQELCFAGSPYIDLYVSTKMSDILTFMPISPCIYKVSDIWPSNRVKVYNKTFYQNYPAKPEQVLIKNYGKDWKTPESNKNGHGQSTCSYRTQPVVRGMMRDHVVRDIRWEPSDE